MENALYDFIHSFSDTPQLVNKSRTHAFSHGVISIYPSSYLPFLLFYSFTPRIQVDIEIDMLKLEQVHVCGTPVRAEFWLLFTRPLPAGSFRSRTRS